MKISNTLRDLTKLWSVWRYLSIWKILPMQKISLKMSGNLKERHLGKLRNSKKVWINQKKVWENLKECWKNWEKFEKIYLKKGKNLKKFEKWWKIVKYDEKWRNLMKSRIWKSPTKWQRCRSTRTERFSCLKSKKKN